MVENNYLFVAVIFYLLGAFSATIVWAFFGILRRGPIPRDYDPVEFESYDETRTHYR